MTTTAEDEALLRRQLAPLGAQGIGELLRRHAAQGQQVLLDPRREAQVVGLGRRRQQQRQGLPQVADCLVRHAGIHGGFEKIPPVERDAWLQLEGWQILYGADGPETKIARAAIDNALTRLPQMLSGLV